MFLLPAIKGAEPFYISPQIHSLAHHLTSNKKTTYQKGAALFKWINHNIQYKILDTYKRQNSLQIFTTRHGCCDEQSILYIAMCRSINISSRFLYVNIDTNYSDVSHACAQFWNLKRWVTVDPAYHMFDFKHAQGKIWSDTYCQQYYQNRRW